MSADLSPVRYEVVHVTEYDYVESVAVSHHVARLRPRTLPGQACHRHELRIEPAPAVVTTHVDCFGNDVTFFAMQGGHTRLRVCAASEVTVAPTPRPDAADTPPWEAAAERRDMPIEAAELLCDPGSGDLPAGLEEYARRSFTGGRPLLAAVGELTARIHADLTFDPKATTVATPLEDVFRTRRGVCQDFARLEIACLRAVGLPARYISGYLETVPPPGSPHLVGADASHAWLAVHCPGIGWIDVDPTNNLFPAGTHITLAWGRDYSDVSPIRGVILGGGSHSLRVNVDVVRAQPVESAG